MAYTVVMFGLDVSRSTVQGLLDLFLSIFSYFLRVGDFKVMSHYDAAIYTARRLEMCEIVEMTLFYFIDRPQVHSALSGLPFMVSTLVIYWVLKSYSSLCGRIKKYQFQVGV